MATLRHGRRRAKPLTTTSPGDLLDSINKAHAVAGLEGKNKKVMQNRPWWLRAPGIILGAHAQGTEAAAAAPGEGGALLGQGAAHVPYKEVNQAQVSTTSNASGL